MLAVTETDRAAWLETRRRSIGSSDAPAVMGLSKWATPIDVYQRKLGLVPDQPETEAMRFGTLLEPVVLGEYEARTGRTIKNRQLFQCHPTRPYMTATLDGMTDEMRVVEAKTANAYADGWGDEETDEIPEVYLVQVQHQLAVTGLDVADVAVLFGGQKFRVYEVRRNPGLIEVIEEVCESFWRCVQSRTPPVWGRVDVKSLAVINPVCTGEVDLDVGAWAALQAYEQAGEQLREIEERQRRCREEILAAMGTAEFGRLPDGRRVKRFLQRVEESTRTVTTKAHIRHFFKVVKGES